MAEDLERLKQRISLLEYLQRHNWTPRRAGTRRSLSDCVPCIRETRPSFYVNARKNLFYCHGCGRGGDLIRFVQLFLDLPFRQSVAHLEQELTSASHFPAAGADSRLLSVSTPPPSGSGPISGAPRTARSRSDRRTRHRLCSRRKPAAPSRGAGLLVRSTSRIGLINSQGRDAFCRRVIFPCRQHGQIVNLYGRSIGAAFPHRLLPRSKGGLFAWESVGSFSTVILVEGLFDLAVLWQAGFRNTTCAIGTQLTPAQLAQLSDQPRPFRLHRLRPGRQPSRPEGCPPTRPAPAGRRHPHPHRPVAAGA